MYLYGAVQEVRGRSLFKTREGKIGLGPKEVKPDDIVTSLLGCNSAMILRPTQTAQYHLVGECFCGGMMAGEALLGALPEPFDLISRYNDELGIYDWAFRNRDSGDFHVEDPRLGDVPLPKGWRRERHENEGFEDWFVHDDSGEDNGYYDPRMNADELRRRGVRLEEFDLI